MKRSIIIVGVIIVLIIIANWWSGQIISEQIDNHMPEIIGQENLGNLTYQSISVSPLLSQIMFKNLRYRTDDNIEFHAETIRTSLTYRDFFRMLTSNPSRTINNISYLSVYIDETSLINHPEATVLTLDDGFFTMQGYVVETIQSILQKRMPSSPLTLDVDMYDLKDQDLNLSQGFLPGFKRNDDAWYVQSFRGSIEYDPVLEHTYLREAVLTAPSITIEMDGIATYPANGSILYPRFLNFDYKLTAEPDNTRFTITQNVGEITMNNVSLESTVHIDLENSFEFSVENLIADGETTFNMEHVRFYPAENLLEDYGPISQAFDVDLSSLYFRNINGKYALDNSRLVIHQTELNTPYLTVLLNIDLDIEEHNFVDSEINEGSIRLSEMASPVQEFIENMETLFSFRFIREEDDEYLIRFRGPLSSPEIIR